MDDLLPEGAFADWNSPENVAQRAADQQQLLNIRTNQIIEIHKNFLKCQNLIEQFYHFLEGPYKNLDIGIGHFEIIFLEFQCLEVYKPLYDALIERNAVGDAERARKVQQIYWSTIAY